jgi:hypothetical protein
MKNYTNLRLFAFSSILFFAFQVSAQNLDDFKESNPGFALGQGLNFNFNEGDYQFKIGGMVQPYIGVQKDSTSDPQYFLNSKRTYFNLAGKAAKEKIAFLVQTDFSLASPLLDAWISYTPSQHLKLSFGQQLTFSNNREMTLMETQLQLIERSILSNKFSATGREFGLFIESQFNLGEIIFMPKVAVTSGDGRNSFGVSSVDYDLGGLKYAYRLDVCPLGKFKEGNNKLIADIKKEEQPKLMLGAAGSTNIGASNSKGAGHGDFYLYNATGRYQLPNYRKLFYDVLFKWNGFSFLGEYIIATGKVEQGTYFDPTAIDALQATEISQVLALGRGYNSSAGYVWNKKYGIDVRYAKLTPEFKSNANSIIKNQDEMSVGITRYINENNLKINASVSQLNTGSSSSILGAFYIQLVF